MQTTGGTKGYGIYGNGLDGDFGQGANAARGGSGDRCRAAGGSGYYGGGSSGINRTIGGSGAGGSSFISGHAGCVAITSETNRDARNDSLGVQCQENTTDIECSKHYSGYIFTNTIMIDGSGFRWTTSKIEPAEGMPKHDGTTGKMTGNSGNGFAKITYLGS